MLKPINSPMSCFGLEHQPLTDRCKSCPHWEPCRTHMGIRLNRVTLDQVKFDLVPAAYVRRHEETDPDVRDVEALYAEIYRQVFGCDPVGYVGIYEEKLVDLAERASCSIPMFILTCMFGHSQAFPDTGFAPSMLVDNRALHRVSVYAEACRERYANFSVSSLDNLVKDDLEVYDLDQRMLRSEILAGAWIIEYKLQQEGQPYLPMFHELEEELDPNWLAIEPRYEETLKAFAHGAERPVQAETKRHRVVLAHKRMKRHKHQAIGNFRARERAMSQAVAQVLAKQDYAPTDFEIEDKLITDPLLFWNRLGLAIQHLECLSLLNYGIGLYAPV